MKKSCDRDCGTDPKEGSYGVDMSREVWHTLESFETSCCSLNAKKVVCATCGGKKTEANV